MLYNMQDIVFDSLAVILQLLANALILVITSSQMAFNNRFLLTPINITCTLLKN
jgi:hypothetical protein